MPSGKNAWLTFLTFDLLIKIVILHALLAVSMTNILLVVQPVLRPLDWCVVIYSCTLESTAILCVSPGGGPEVGVSFDSRVGVVTGAGVGVAVEAEVVSWVGVA